MKRRVILVVVIVGVLGAVVGGILYYRHRNSGQRLLNLARQSIQARKYDDAVAQAGAYIVKYPGDWEGYFRQAQAQGYLGRFADARSGLGKAQGLVGNNASAALSVTLAMARTYSAPAAQTLGAPDPARLEQQMNYAIDQLRRALDDYLDAENIKPALARLSDSKADRAEKLEALDARGMAYLMQREAHATLQEFYKKDADLRATLSDTVARDAKLAQSYEALENSVKAKLQSRRAFMEAVQLDASADLPAETLLQLCEETEEALLKRAGLAKYLDDAKLKRPGLAKLLEEDATLQRDGLDKLREVLGPQPLKDQPPMVALRLAGYDLTPSTGPATGPSTRPASELDRATAFVGRVRQLLKSLPQEPLDAARKALDAGDAYKAKNLAEGALVDVLLTYHPQNAQLLLTRAQLFLNAKDPGQALDRVEKALKVAPGSPGAALIKGKALLASGRAREAERVLQDLLQNLRREHRDSIVAQAAYAEAASDPQVGFTEQARTARLRALELTATSDDENRIQREVRRAMIKQPGGDAAAAFDYARQVCASPARQTEDVAVMVGKAIDTQRQTQAREELARLAKDSANQLPFLLAVAEGYDALAQAPKGAESPAEEQARAKDAQDAAEAYKGLANRTPATPVDTYCVARGMIRTGDIEKAKSLLLSAQAGAPNEPLLSFGLGQVYAGTGLLLQALQAFDKAIVLRGDNPAFLMARAKLRYGMGQLSESREDCEAVLALDQKSNEAVQLKTEIDARLPSQAAAGGAVSQTEFEKLPPVRQAQILLVERGDAPKCIVICERERAKTPNDQSLLRLLADAYLADNQRGKCVELSHQILQNAPDQLPNYQRLAGLLEGEMDVDAVIAAMAKDTADAPPKVKPLVAEMLQLTRASLLERAGALPEAAAAYKQLADRRGETRGLAWLGRARMLQAAGLLDQAIAELKPLESDPLMGTQTRLLRANLLAASGHAAEARDLAGLLRTKAVADRDVPMLLQLAQLYLDAKEPATALAVCDEAQTLQPMDVRVLQVKARVLLATGKPDEAVKVYNEAIGLQPSLSDLYTTLSAVLDGLQRPLEALDVLKKLEDQGDAGRKAATYQRGVLFLRWGMPQKALESFEALGTLGLGTHPQTQLAKGQALAMLGQIAPARQTLDAIPKYAKAAYLQGRDVLMALAKTPDERLARLAEMEQAGLGLVTALQERMETLIQARRYGEAVRAYSDFVRKYGQVRTLDAGPSPLAVQAMLLAGDPQPANELVLKLAERSSKPPWPQWSALIELDSAPDRAAALVPPDPSRATGTGALMGLCVAIRRGADTQPWVDRIVKGPKGEFSPAVQLLCCLAGRAQAQADEILAQFKGERLIGRTVAAELASSIRADPASASVAGQLLKALMAARAGLPQLGATWAMDALKARPKCQWAAALAAEYASEEAALPEVLKLLQPADCPLALTLQARICLAKEDHPQALALYERAAAAEADNLSLLLERAEAIERSQDSPPPDAKDPQAKEQYRVARLKEALEVYTKIIQADKTAVAMNNAAYICLELFPTEKDRLAAAQQWADEAVKQAPQPAFLDTRGWAACRLGNYEEACALLRRSVAGLPRSPDVHYHLGLAEAGAKRPDLARWHLAAAKAFGEAQRVDGKPVSPAVERTLRLIEEALAKLPTTAPSK